MGIRKTDTFSGESVDVWRFVVRASLATQIHPAEVVNQEQHNIGRASSARDEDAMPNTRDTLSRAILSIGVVPAAVFRCRFSAVAFKQRGRN